MKYIAYYDVDGFKCENRVWYLSAVNKINYIGKAIYNATGEKLEIISVAQTQNCRFYKGRRNALDFGELVIFPTIPGGNPFFRRISAIFTQGMLFFYLLKNTKKGEPVMAWHSVGYGNALAWAKKIKKFKLILEVEEIYQNVRSLGSIKNKREYRDFRIADKFIFPTTLLNDKLNKENKPYSIIHGTYEVEKDQNVSFDDDKVHIVYAGTFDSRKGGATVAAAAAQYLPEKYHIHIIGFGSKKDVDNIKKIVSETNGVAKATVTYDGLLSGDEYIEFLQKCHIGLSTQNPDASFNATSFPSKILSYMANGLKVVTIRIPAIEGSAVGNDVCYYDKQTPVEVANAIMEVDLNDGVDPRGRIKELDKEFCQEIKKLINRR